MSKLDDILIYLGEQFTSGGSLMPKDVEPEKLQVKVLIEQIVRDEFDGFHDGSGTSAVVRTIKHRVLQKIEEL